MALSGGGCFGAYQVGVMAALLNGRSPATRHRPIDPTVLLGTSIGSLNAALLLSSRESSLSGAVDYLRRTWINEISSSGSSGNGLIRFRGKPTIFDKPRTGEQTGNNLFSQVAEDAIFTLRDCFSRGAKFLQGNTNFEQRFLELFDLGSLVSVQPMIELIQRRIHPDRIRLSGRKLRIPATNWRTGQMRVFTEEHMTAGLGHLAIQASTALPGIFPSVEIEGEPYADGGLQMNTPIAPAILAGADIIHAVHMDPDISSIGLPKVTDTFSSIYRLAVFAWATSVERDIERIASVNRGLELLEESIRAGVNPDEIDLTLSAMDRRKQSGASTFRPITIHRYYPDMRSGETIRWLDCGKEQVTNLIQRGFEDTLRHDCVRNRCVTPQSSKPGYCPKPLRIDSLSSTMPSASRIQ